MNIVACYFSQWGKGKAPLVKERMRDLQVGLIDDFFVEKKDVHIDGALLPFFLSALSPQLFLYRKNFFHQFRCAEPGPDLRYRVQKGRLAGVAPGSGFVNGDRKSTRLNSSH